MQCSAYSFLYCTLMPLPYGSAGSLLGEYDIKKKSWERVIFEASSLELLAQAEVLQEAQTAIVQRTTRTMCVFAREGVLKLTANEAVGVRTWTQRLDCENLSCFSYLACAPTTKVAQLCLTEGCLQNPGQNPMPSSIMSGCPRRALRLRNQAGLPDSLLRF